ncbi:LacI family DNA-binding transcriptional regulator [Cellulomonas fengjieae]|uniref:LacI family DNA-binding transcriptional regulator n=1 Tax=Cellulomonas fengjieae TaxID=2819978 RepID=UPI001AAF882D|nr:LacI family DNA-binding transcriptional regulator [Cellulomonas fengjieae]MBO3102537.1 LacI family DNA-binding transcriptional regulator [Cellulomonas fengjieae]
MADVARHAGVSVKTVSNVLSGYPHIRDATRERVLAAVDALGYEINVTARIFRSGRSGVVGLAVPEVGQPYFGELADEVLEAARRHGLQVLIEPTGFTRDGELAALRVPRRGLIDGLIFSPAALVQSDAHLLEGLGYPLVLLGEQLFSSSVDHVSMHNVEGARAATDLLLDAGRHRIAVLGMLHARTAGSASLRFSGYRDALAARGIDVDSRHLGWADDGWHRANGARAMAQVLDSGAPVDGVVAFNDALAIGAMHELQTRGLAIPQDVAVVGFDDIEDSRFCVPTLTTIDPGRREIAEVAVEILHRRVQERLGPGRPQPPVLHRAGMRLVERESTPTRRAGA